MKNRLEYWVTCPEQERCSGAVCVVSRHKKFLTAARAARRWCADCGSGIAKHIVREVRWVVDA